MVAALRAAHPCTLPPVLLFLPDLYHFTFTNKTILLSITRCPSPAALSAAACMQGRCYRRTAAARRTAARRGMGRGQHCRAATAHAAGPALQQAPALVVGALRAPLRQRLRLLPTVDAAARAAGRLQIPLPPPLAVIVAVVAATGRVARRGKGSGWSSSGARQLGLGKLQEQAGAHHPPPQLHTQPCMQIEALTRAPGCAPACGPYRCRGCCAPAPGTCTTAQQWIASVLFREWGSQTRGRGPGAWLGLACCSALRPTSSNHQVLPHHPHPHPPVAV